MNRKILCSLCLFLGLLSASFALEVGDPAEDKGTRLDMPGGGQVQLTVEDNKIIAVFIDEEGLIMEPNAESILFIIDDPLSDKDTWRTVLSRDGLRMAGSRLLHAPYAFRTKIIVRYGDKEPVSFSRQSVNLSRNQ